MKRCTIGCGAASAHQSNRSVCGAQARSTSASTPAYQVSCVTPWVPMAVRSTIATVTPRSRSCSMVRASRLDLPICRDDST